MAAKAGTAPKPTTSAPSSTPTSTSTAPETTPATQTPATEPAAADRAPSRPAKSSTRSTSSPGRVRSVLAGGSTVDNGAGIILAAVALFWVVIPFARGGVDEVRAVWHAKWTNKDMQGRWL